MIDGNLVTLELIGLQKTRTTQNNQNCMSELRIAGYLMTFSQGWYIYLIEVVLLTTGIEI